MTSARRLIDRPRRCPTCGSRCGVRILYGLPTPEAGLAADRGEIVLGGCIVGPNQPDRACTACGHEWRAGRGGGSGLGPRLV